MMHAQVAGARVRYVPWMNRILGHVVLPALAPAALIVLALTPLTVVGCAPRGLLALGIALISAAAAFVSLYFAWRAGRGTSAANWWVLSGVICTVPLALLVGPLG